MGTISGIPDKEIDLPEIPVQTQLRRFRGTVEFEPTRVGRDASHITKEVISNQAGRVVSRDSVTLEV